MIVKNIRRNVKSRVERVLNFVMRRIYVNDKRKKKMMQMIFAKSMIAMRNVKSRVESVFLLVMLRMDVND